MVVLWDDFYNNNFLYWEIFLKRKFEDEKFT